MRQTRVWNQGAVEPLGFQDMGQPVRTGGANLIPERRGMKVLVDPLGSPEYVAWQIRKAREEHDALLQALRDLPELQPS